MLPKEVKKHLDNYCEPKEELIIFWYGPENFDVDTSDKKELKRWNEAVRKLMDKIDCSFLHDAIEMELEL
jgi:hypothetical protein